MGPVRQWFSGEMHRLALGGDCDGERECWKYFEVRTSHQPGLRVRKQGVCQSDCGNARPLGALLPSEENSEGQSLGLRGQPAGQVLTPTWPRRRSPALRWSKAPVRPG